MSILSGMTGLKAAADLTRALRDGLKSGQIRGDDISGRIGEIYDYIVDSKDALVEAKDEIHELKEKVTYLGSRLDQRDAMKFVNGAYWTKTDGPFCQICWESETKAIRLSKPIVRIVAAPPTENVWYTCYFHQELRIPLPERLAEFREKLSAEGRLS
jgi:hypothetical protein